MTKGASAPFLFVVCQRHAYAGERLIPVICPRSRRVRVGSGRVI